MCLGIPGQIVEMVDDNDHLAKVEITGVRRMINIGLLEDEDLCLGDWVLIHVGFAMSKIDEAEARLALDGLMLMGQAYTDEIDAVQRFAGRSSRTDQDRGITMGAIIGFILGYVLGTKSGDNGFAELQDSWRTISSSEEVKDLLAGGFAMARDLVRQGAGLVAGRLAGEPELRSVA